MQTMGQARRAAGIPESEYINTALERDTVERISTIRTLVRWFGPPDARFEHIGCMSLWWSQYAPQGERSVTILPGGSITS